MARKPVTVRDPGADYEIRIVGDRHMPLRDFYHALLELPWWATISTISGAFLAANALFALAYLLVGGVEHAGRGSFRDAFFFSVQTMGTIGYGAMFPASTAANVVVVVESIVSLLFTALSTALVVAKISRPTARVMFTRHAVISLFDGVPTLMFRLGNERGNQIVDAAALLLIVLIRSAIGERVSVQPLQYARAIDHAVPLPRALNGFRIWVALMVALTAVNYGYPIAQHFFLKGEVPASVVSREK